MSAPTSPSPIINRQPSPPLPPNPLTIRRPPFTYFHLILLSSASFPLLPSTAPTKTDIDILTVHKYLALALQQFLGETGLAIPIDFLKLDGANCWIRVPREDGVAVGEALSGWVGGGELAWRIMGRGDWLGAVVAGTGRGIFDA